MTMIKALRTRIGLFTHSETSFEFCLYSFQTPPHNNPEDLFYRLFDIEVLFCKEDPGYLLASGKLHPSELLLPGVTSFTDLHGQIYLSSALLKHAATRLEAPLLSEICQFRKKEIVSGAADHVFRRIPSLEIYRPFCEIEIDFSHTRLAELATVADEAMHRFRYSQTLSPDTRADPRSSSLPPAPDKSKRLGSEIRQSSGKATAEVPSEECPSTTNHVVASQDHHRHTDVSEIERPQGWTAANMNERLLRETENKSDDGTGFDGNRKRIRSNVSADYELFTNPTTWPSDDGLHTDIVSNRGNVITQNSAHTLGTANNEEQRPSNDSVSQLAEKIGLLVQPDQSNNDRNQNSDGKSSKKNMRNLTICTERQEEEHNTALRTAPPHTSSVTIPSMLHTDGGTSSRNPQDQSQSSKNPDMRTQPQTRQSSYGDSYDGSVVSLPPRPMTSVQPPKSHSLKLPRLPAKRRLAPRIQSVGPEASRYTHPIAYPTYSSATSADNYAPPSAVTQRQRKTPTSSSATNADNYAPTSAVPQHQSETPTFSSANSADNRAPPSATTQHQSKTPTFSSQNSADNHAPPSATTQHQRRSTDTLPPIHQMSNSGAFGRQRNVSDQWNASTLTHFPVPISPMLYTPVVPSTPTHLPNSTQGPCPTKAKADFMRIMETVYMQTEDTEDLRLQLEERLCKATGILQKLENVSLMIEGLARQHFRGMSAAREHRITKAISELGQRMTKVETFLTKREEERSRAKEAVKERLRERDAERAKQMEIDPTNLETGANDITNENSLDSLRKPKQLAVNVAKANSISALDIPAGYSPFLMKSSVRPPTPGRPLFPTNYAQVRGTAAFATSTAPPSESMHSSSGTTGRNKVIRTSGDGEEEESGGQSTGSEAVDEGEIEVVEQCGQVQRKCSPRKPFQKPDAGDGIKKVGERLLACLDRMEGLERSVT